MNTTRLSKLCAKMKEKGIDQFIVTAKPNLYYFTDRYIDPMERLLALLVDADGNCTYYVNRLFVVDVPECEVVRWDDLEDPVAIMAKKVIPAGTVAVDGDWPARFLLRMIQEKPNTHFLCDPAPINELRTIKDAREIELLTESSRINDLVMEEIWANISPNRTEEALSRLRYELFAQHGANAYQTPCVYSYGAQCADAHHVSDDTRLQSGDSVMIDMGAVYQHYRSDETRTVFYQTVTPEMEKVYHLVLEAHLKAIEHIKPGVLCSQIDKTARDIISAAGYGDYFTHRTGHGIGLSTHEFPDISGKNHCPIEEGMVFSIEPGIYLPNKGGVRIENLVVVTQTGCQSLNHLPRALKIIP